MKEETGLTLARQWEMLRTVPRAPQKITTATLESRLRDAGYAISRRTIERDLHALSARFPLTLDDRSRPFGWSWSKSVRFDILPGLTTPQAVALLLAQKHLEPLLPRSLHDELAGLFAAAEKTVSASGWKDWHKRTAVMATGLSLTPPVVDSSVLATVQSALAHRHCLHGQYRSKGSRELHEYRLHPLGLIARGPVLYLAATVFDYADVRQFALHRFKCVEELAQPRREPEGFDFAIHVANAGTYIASRGAIRLVCRFDAPAAEHLWETPLSPDQTWKEIEDGQRVEITATIEDDDRLRWWLLAFGSQVEVVSPKSLRVAIRDELFQAECRYA